MAEEKYPVVENHPLVPVFGHFKDDLTWDEYQKAILECRRQLNSAEEFDGGPDIVSQPFGSPHERRRQS